MSSLKSTFFIIYLVNEHNNLYIPKSVYFSYAHMTLLLDRHGNIYKLVLGLLTVIDQFY